MTRRKPYQYVSLDGSRYIPANEVFVQGEPYFGSKWSDILMPTGLVKAMPGQRVYVTNESDERTYSGTMNDDGTVSDLKVFAYQGGESLARIRRATSISQRVKSTSTIREVSCLTSSELQIGQRIWYSAARITARSLS